MLELEVYTTMHGLLCGLGKTQVLMFAKEHPIDRIISLSQIIHIFTLERITLKSKAITFEALRTNDYTNYEYKI